MRVPREHDTFAASFLAHRVADFLDGSGSLMSQDDRHRIFQLTFDDLQIGVTEPHCGDFD
jgi:hypothetical protein